MTRLRILHNFENYWSYRYLTALALPCLVALQESEALKSSNARANAELKKLKDAETNIKKQREKAMKEMENQVKASTKVVNGLKAEVSTLKSKRDAINAELAAIQRDLQSLSEQRASSESGLGRLEEEERRLSKKVCGFAWTFDMSHLDGTMHDSHQLYLYMMYIYLYRRSFELACRVPREVRRGQAERDR
jgi:septal ring factor EnvC (AmiA/AmiB activator)